MRQPDYEFDDALRRALHTVADGIEPGADGLERIRSRLTAPRPLSAAWLQAGYGDLARPAASRLKWLLDGLIAWLWPPRASSPARPPSPRAGKLGQRYRWLRPVAVAAAVVIAVTGGYGLTQLRSTMSNPSELYLPLVGGKQHHQGGSVENHGSGPIIGPSNASGAGTGSSSPSPSPSTSCSPGPGKGPHVHNTPPATPTPTPSPTLTPSPTPTPSPSGTGEPSGSPSPSPSDSGGGTSDSPATSPASAVYAAALSTSPASPGPSQSSRSRCGTSPSPTPGVPRHRPNQRAGKVS